MLILKLSMVSSPSYSCLARCKVLIWIRPDTVWPYPFTVIAISIAAFLTQMFLGYRWDFYPYWIYSGPNLLFEDLSPYEKQNYLLQYTRTIRNSIGLRSGLRGLCLARHVVCCIIYRLWRSLKETIKSRATVVQLQPFVAAWQCFEVGVDAVITGWPLEHIT